MCSDAQHYCSNSNISGFEVPNNTKVIKNRQSQAVQKTSREVIKPQNLLQAVSKIQTSAKETKRKLRSPTPRRPTSLSYEEMMKQRRESLRCLKQGPAKKALEQVLLQHFGLKSSGRMKK